MRYLHFDGIYQAADTMRSYFSRPDAVLAKSTDNRCQYRTQSGDKCAVGCLIPDALYESFIVSPEDGNGHENELENKTVSGLVGKSDELDAIINGDSPEGKLKLAFLNQAQTLHDTNARDAADFVRLISVAQDAFMTGANTGFWLGQNDK
jgi:hypothetical protein